MCNCVILDVTVKQILITAFLKKLPFLAKGLPDGLVKLVRYIEKQYITDIHTNNLK